jgi:hypothetical protein
LALKSFFTTASQQMLVRINETRHNQTVLCVNHIDLESRGFQRSNIDLAHSRDLTGQEQHVGIPNVLRAINVSPLQNGKHHLDRSGDGGCGPG